MMNVQEEVLVDEDENGSFDPSFVPLRAKVLPSTFGGDVMIRPWLTYFLAKVVQEEDSLTYFLANVVQEEDDNDESFSFGPNDAVSRCISAKLGPKSCFLPESDDKSLVCTAEDKRSFFAAIARLPHELSLSYVCHEIFSGLLTIPDMDHFKVKSLNITQGTLLSELEYVRLGAMIQGSIHLIELSLQLPFEDIPQEFYDSVAQCIHLQKLWLKAGYMETQTKDQREAILSKLVAGEGGNGLVERILRNPQNQLILLNLSGNYLEDHLLAIGQLLPTSRVEYLNLSYTCMQTRGLLQFARYLPSMHSMKRICLQGNPWESSPLEDRQECGVALLQGVLENPSLTWIDGWDEIPQCFPLWHYLSLNRAGRHLVTSPQPTIPDGLRPHILERAGRIINYELPIYDILQDDGGYCGHASAIYFFLQHLTHTIFLCT